MRAADAAWIALPRWNTPSRDEQRRYAPICPDFVMELRSPGDRVPGLEARMEQWIANGAQLGWLVDPLPKVVAVYRPGCEVRLLEDPNTIQGEGPVQGFELPIAEMWK